MIRPESAPCTEARFLIGLHDALPSKPPARLPHGVSGLFGTLRAAVGIFWVLTSGRYFAMLD
jgi:hypothetical protein